MSTDPQVLCSVVTFPGKPAVRNCYTWMSLCEEIFVNFSMTCHSLNVPTPTANLPSKFQQVATRGHPQRATSSTSTVGFRSVPLSFSELERVATPSGSVLRRLSR
jgi:hypothetical protein